VSSARAPIRTIRSRTLVLPSTNIDTDQIIPARFLTTISREGLGERLFTDWRYAPDGTPRPEFILNRPESKGCQVLVAGRNFGCGSSREHAPWALLDYGIRAVISTGIADIFRSNALKNGLLPVIVDETTSGWLLDHPGVEVDIDLESKTLTLPDGRSVTFPVEAFARYCLLNGIDELGFLLAQQDRIAAYERKLA
jgi:3-isopropylmalate/(R)-2-methylmalate dehydratase small subunit